MQPKFQILWADDEIDLLKPHILFLEKKGYEVVAVNNGQEAVEKCENEHFDVVFLDENMPGMNGLEVLNKIKVLRPNLPVVMITKSEEENIMEEAIGSRIADYLIKPVNPNQILLSVKKILESKKLVSEKTNSGYRQDFRNISMAFSDELSFAEWTEVYRKLVFWELEIERTEYKSMQEVLETQKQEANVTFAKFIRENYEYWLNDAEDDERPVMSHDLIPVKVLPLLEEHPDKRVFFILIDNLRFDQWKILEEIISDYFRVLQEEMYYSILPTTTAYARNAIFSGMLPLEIYEEHPEWWVGDDEEGNKNDFEGDMLKALLEECDLGHVACSYHKIIRYHQAKNLSDNFSNLLDNRLNALVFNFVDMLSHARTDTNLVRELAHDESAYRAVTKAWFLHSHLLDILKKIAEAGDILVITTDHGTIRTKNPYKIIGDRETNTNLRYKQGKNLNYQPKNVIVARKPEQFFLPKVNVTTSYVFATEDYFFAYPNNYNHYVKYYKDTFQHGGVSLEEMIIPFVILQPK
jgi:CheY-like chemotaxis protein